MNKIRTLLSLISILVLLCISLGSCTVGGGEQNINLDQIPIYCGEPYVAINGNAPFFTEEEITTESFERYSELDSLARCGIAFSCIGKDLMPTEEREDISSVTPSGWEVNGVSNNKKYGGNYLYNRCHLIGHQLTGENDNERNLITGTRYLNIDGMLPFENQIAAYVKDTDNHVMYRVTPIYDGYNLVASGVLMEGYSVEDEGDGIYFCVYAYNVQPGVNINYYNGTNAASGESLPEGNDNISEESEVTYVLNTNSKKYHLPSCSSAINMKEENKQEYIGEKDAFVVDNPTYTPCGICKPDEN